MTVRKNVPAKKFSLGSLFLPVFSRGTSRNHIFGESVARKKYSQ
jgi:hypothetical protein